MQNSKCKQNALRHNEARSAALFTPVRRKQAVFAFCILNFAWSLVVVLSASQAAPAAQTAPASAQELTTINQYCVTCHNDRAKVGGLSLEGVTPESIGQRAEVFEKAGRKPRGRVMPPPGARQPPGAAVDSL